MMNLNPMRASTTSKRGLMQSTYYKKSNSLQKKSIATQFQKKLLYGRELGLSYEEFPPDMKPITNLFIQANNYNETQNKNEKEKKYKKPKFKVTELSTKRKHNQNLKVKNFLGTKLQKKLQSYFLFINLASCYLKVNFAKRNEHKFTVYVGKGNNSKLIKRLFRLRHWWNVTNNPDNEEINLTWTQWSKKSIFELLSNESLRTQQIGKSLYSKKQYSNQYNLILPKNIRQKSRKLCDCESENNIKTYLQTQKQQKLEQSSVKITRSCNHIEGHQELTDKKNLFYCLSQYYAKKNRSCFQIVPLTFHIEPRLLNQGITMMKQKILELPQQQQNKLMWILKPGQKSNRGNGIKVFNKIEELQSHIQKNSQLEKYSNRTYIIQRYIKPALFHKRKFDIRCFVLLVSCPLISAYFYNDAYIRTSSRQYKQKKLDDKYIHLTNDAIQKKGSQYGKFEKGNKINLEEYQTYLDFFEKDKNINFKAQIFPKLKYLATKSVTAAVQSSKMNKSGYDYSFQLLGYDFMLDQNFKPWLIEVNTNPCLQLGCPVLDKIIPSMLNNVLKLAVDPVFKPQKSKDWSLQAAITFPEIIFEPNRYQIIFGTQDKIFSSSKQKYHIEEIQIF